MAKQTVDVGTSASDGTGDDLRVAFTKINENFTELYSGNVQVTAANVLVYSVAGRTGNVVLSVNDISGGVSKAYVNQAIAANIADVSGATYSAINANVAAANLVISNHSSRITTLESNSSAQALQINSLVNVKANVSYVDTSIDYALSNSAIAANLTVINANITAANLAIAALQSNATVQAISINTLLSNAASQGSLLNSLLANAANQGSSLNSLLANAASQTNDIVALQGNTGVLAASINSLTANAAIQENKITGLRANITAANAAIITLTANAATQETEITGLQASITAANVNITSLLSNASIQQSTLDSLSASIVTLTANVGTQATTLNTLTANAATQAVTLATLTANASAQSIDLVDLWTNAAAQGATLNLLLSNAVTQQDTLATLTTTVNTLTANAATQENEVTGLRANITAANAAITSLTSNAGVQSANISTLTSNVGTIFSLITLGNAAIANLTSDVSNLNSDTSTIFNLISLGNAAISSLQTYSANLSGAVFTGNVTARNVISNANLFVKETIHVGNLSTTDFPGLIGTFINDVPGYSQIILQNLSSDPDASSDFVVTADDGNNEIYYLDIGINNSNWSGNFIGQYGDTGLPEHAHEGYVAVIGGNLALRSDANIFLAANTSAVALLQDGPLYLYNSNLKFSDGTVQSSAIIDVPGLYANLGTATTRILNLQNGQNANIAYTMANYQNWTSNVSTIGQALDQLAARLKALGG